MLTNGNLALQAIDRAIINRDIAPPTSPFHEIQAPDFMANNRE